MSVAQQWYQITGPDGKVYKTQADSPEAAKAKIPGYAKPTSSTSRAAPAARVSSQWPGGVGRPMPGAPKGQAEPTMRHPGNVWNSFVSGQQAQLNPGVGTGVLTGAAQLAQGTYDIGKDLVNNPNWLTGEHSTFNKFIKTPADVELAKSIEQWKQPGLGHKVEALGHGLASELAFVGPWASHLGELTGKGQGGEAFGEGVGTLLTGKLGSSLVEQVTDSAVLREKAAKLDTKVLKTANAGAKDLGMSAGLQVAQESIVGTARSLPGKLERAQQAVGRGITQMAQHLNSMGVTINVMQDILPVLKDAIAVMNQRGVLTPQVKAQIGSLVRRLTTQTDMQTGNVIPRDLTKLTMTDALALTKGLEDMSAFGKDVPKPIENIARRIRGAINDRIGKTSPEIQSERARQSRLITARDAARENLTAILNDKARVARGVIYSNVPTIGAWLALRGLGLMTPITALGSVIAIKSLAESTLSRTMRAALYAKAADIFDRSMDTQAAAAPSSPPQPGSPGGGSMVPQGLQPAGPQGVTPQAGPAALTPQAAPVVRPPLQLGPSTLPEAPKASQATPAEAMPKTELSLDERLKQTFAQSKSVGQKEGEWSVKAKQELFPGRDRLTAGEASQVAQRALEMRVASETGRRSVERKAPMSATELEAAMKLRKPIQTPFDVTEGAMKTIERDPNMPKPPQRGVAQRNTTQVGESGVSPHNKAMLDRLDSLFERMEKPKSGADRVAIGREIDEIKRVLSGEANPKEQAKINKRIADRERLAGKRQTAASQTSFSGVTSAGGETVSQQASPEMRALLLDQGYKKLSTYENGDQMVKALQNTAKAMHSKGLPYDEVQALTDGLNALKEIENIP